MKWLLVALVFPSCVPRLIWTGRDPQRQLSAEVFQLGSEQWLSTGATAGTHFSAIGTDGVVFSPEGGRVAYPAVRNGRWSMVVGADTLGPWDGVAEPHFSHDGARFAFLAQTGDRWRVVVDGAVGRPFEHIQGDTLHFSPAGSHLAFVGSDGSCARIVIDRIEGPCRDRVVSMRVTDTGLIAAVIRDGLRERFLLEPPGKPAELGPPFDAITEWTTTDDGNHTAYVAQESRRASVVVDGLAAASCLRIRHLRFGDAGKRIAWVCGEKSGAAVVIDGEPGQSYATVSAPLLSSLSSDFAYVAREARGAWVVSDDSSWGPFPEVVDLVLSSRGHGVAFIARSGGATRVIHRDQQTTLGAVVEGSLVLSDDGDHWAAIAGDPVARELWLTVDGTRHRAIEPSEVFGEPSPRLAAWMERELREALARPPKVSKAGAP